MSNIILKTDITQRLPFITDINNIVFEYIGNSCILQEFKINSDIHTYAIFGKRQSGKTTLAKHLANQYGCKVFAFTKQNKVNPFEFNELHNTEHLIDMVRKTRQKIVVIFDEMYDVQVLNLMKNAKHYNIIVIVISSDDTKYYNADCVFFNNASCPKQIARHLERKISKRIIGGILKNVCHRPSLYLVLKNNILLYYKK